MKPYCLLFIFTLLPLVCVAEQEKTFGDYDVHYSVINSTFVSPSVAKSYDLLRAKNSALINIAIRKRLPKGRSQAQTAKVTGSSSDLIHSAELDFKEVVEQDAIYYLAQLRFNHKEMRTFTIKVQPDPTIAPYSLKFSKTLYVDE